MGDLRLEMALQGSAEDWVARVEKATLEALGYATFRTARFVQDELRDDVRKAGLGDGIANAWRIEHYPKHRKLSWNPGAFIWSNAAHIVEAHARGEPIRAGGGGLLAVPIPDSPAWSMKIRPGEKRTDKVVQRFGPLRLIVPRRGPPMLVAAGRGDSAGGLRPLRKVRHKGSGATFTPLNQPRVDIPMFWLVPQVRLEKRLSWPAIFARQEGQFAANVEAELRAHIARMTPPSSRLEKIA